MNYKEAAVQIVLDKYEAIKLERETNLQNLKSSLQNHKKQLVFFGAGVLGKSLYVLFQSEGIQANMFCDNNKSLWGGG